MLHRCRSPIALLGLAALLIAASPPDSATASGPPTVEVACPTVHAAVPNILTEAIVLRDIAHPYVLGDLVRVDHLRPDRPPLITVDRPTIRPAPTCASRSLLTGSVAFRLEGRPRGPMLNDNQRSS